LSSIIGENAEVQAAEHISGSHLQHLLCGDGTERLSELVGTDLGHTIAEWHRLRLDGGKNDPDYIDPYPDDLRAVPMSAPLAEQLADRGAETPTRQQVRRWVKDGPDGIDPEIELLRAQYATDPDLAPETPPAKRICGVPEDIYDVLTDDEKLKVRAGRVIPPPGSPMGTARWLARNVFTQRHRGPQKRRRGHIQMRTLLRIDETWYRYDGTRWTADTNGERMHGWLQRILGDKWYVHDKVRTPGGAETHTYRLKSWNPDTMKLARVEAALAAELDAGTGTHARELPDAYGNHYGYYPPTGTWTLCRNGVLDVTTGELRPACPLWFSTTRIEADYDHAADPYADSEWLRMLRTQWADDPGAITGLQQWFGYIISGRTDLQKWMLVIGPPGSGKSIIADVLGALLGMVIATSLDSLNSHYGLQNLYETGANLALMGDIRFSARDSSTAVENLLKITGEDDSLVHRKYKTTVTTRLTVRFHGSANELPRFTDNAAALQQRALILETTRGFRGTEDEDPGLRKRILTDELGHVLRWAVEGLALLDAAEGTFARSGEADELADQLAELASPIRTFVNECCELGDADDFVGLQPLYRVWRKWADENNTGRGMSQNRFRAALRGLGMPEVRPGQKKMPDGGNGKWSVVWGVKRAETAHTERGLHGVEIARTASTDLEQARRPYGSELN
jgi:putative DNA primase/helicase